MCGKCGAVREDLQLGLEATPELYVENLVAIMREVWRVLRNNGTLWLNLGDSYASAWASGRRSVVGQGSRTNRIIRMGGDLKEKDLIGIPWMVAFALRSDGWYLRSDIIWNKPNPMPESVTDRPTKSHEYLFLLTKSAKYFYDSDAIKEEAAYDGRKDTVMKGSQKYADGFVPNQSEQTFHARGHERWQRGEDGEYLRNKRSVWTVNTKPFSEAHFAVFPPKLIEPCVLAGTSEKGCCRACGAPYDRLLERVDKGWDGSKYGERVVGASGGAISGGTAKSTLGSSNGKLVGTQETKGWQPSCKCEADIIPCTVLDPFSGAGTTGLVSLRHNRNYIGIELNPEYVEMSRKRIYMDAPMFNEEKAA